MAWYWTQSVGRRHLNCTLLAAVQCCTCFCFNIFSSYTLYSHHNHMALVSNPMAPPKLHNACCSAPASASAMQHFLCQTPMALTSQSHGTYITITLAFTSQWHGAHITITLALTSQSHAASRHLYCTLLLTCNSFSCATPIVLTSNDTHMKSHHIHI